jgi:hypothetical protein
MRRNAKTSIKKKEGEVKRKFEVVDQMEKWGGGRQKKYKTRAKPDRINYLCHKNFITFL